jgi:biopolymer transport protein ExbB/TolQ
LEILPSTTQSNLVVGVVVFTALVLVTSFLVWCAFYLLIKCCKRCSRDERETRDDIEMAEQQHKQQPSERQQERGEQTLTRTQQRGPRNNATADETRNGEMLNLIKFKVSISKFQTILIAPVWLCGIILDS